LYDAIMGAVERVTITLPEDIVAEIDRLDRNRSRFVLGALRNELDRRRRAELERSLANPHHEAGEIAEEGFDEWAARLPAPESDLLQPAAGRGVRWSPGKGWQDADE
jgi:hypothetical protein